MKKRVLILGVAPNQKDAVAQLKQMGCETYTCAIKKDGPAADLADHFTQIDVIDEEAIASYIEENNIHVVYSTGSDLAIPVSCRISENLGLPHFVSSATAYICNHKNAMREKLTNECIGNIPYQVMGRAGMVEMPFPVILKPSDAQGQRGIFLINSQQEFETHFNEAVKFSTEKKVIIEKFIDGPELSVNGYLVDGSIKFLVVSDRITWPGLTGLIHKHIVPTKILEPETQEKLYYIIEDACRRVEIINGPVYFQIKLDNQVPYIIEMTPRLDGCHMWDLLRRATGVNIMKLTFEHLVFNDISELKKINSVIMPMELVFFCQVPNTIMDTNVYKIPENALHSVMYYGNGEKIRSINGRFEKVGYYIHKI